MRLVTFCLPAFLLSVSFVLSGCESVSTGGAHNPVIPTNASAAVLRPGDSLIVTLQSVPDPTNNQVQIDESGLISLPFIGTVTAVGLNTAELAQRIRETYITRKFYNSVDVSVTVTERFVYVGGEIQRPGRIVWTPDLTLAKAIQAAGGFSLYAKETAVSLVRENHAYQVNVVLAQRQPVEDPLLMPGDSIQVPRSSF